MPLNWFLTETRELSQDAVLKGRGGLQFADLNFSTIPVITLIINERKKLSK
jgi:hypothetical protein